MFCTWVICWRIINLFVELEIFLFIDLNIIKCVLLVRFKDSLLLVIQVIFMNVLFCIHDRYQLAKIFATGKNIPVFSKYDREGDV